MRRLNNVLLLLAFLAGTFFSGSEVLAQQTAACDSLQRAWYYYYDEPIFERAEALVAGCEDLNALELRAYIAYQRGKFEEAKEIICRLLKQKPDYAPGRKSVPKGFEALVEARKKECAPQPPRPPKTSNVIPPRLPWLPFLPDAYVMDSLGISLNMGTIFNFSEDEDQRAPDLASFGLGIRGIVGFELGTMEIVNKGLDEKNKSARPELLTASLKFQPLLVRWHMPIFKRLQVTTAVAGIARISISKWGTDRRDNVAFHKKLETYHAVVSIACGPVGIHGGLSRITPKFNIKRQEGEQDCFVVPAPADSNCEKAKEINYMAPGHSKPVIFAALQWRFFTDLVVMVGLGHRAEYDFDLNPAKLEMHDSDNLDVKQVWVGGARWNLPFVDGLAIDGAVIHRPHSKTGEDPTSIRIGLHVQSSLYRISEVF